MAQSMSHSARGLGAGAALPQRRPLAAPAPLLLRRRCAPLASTRAAAPGGGPPQLPPRPSNPSPRDDDSAYGRALDSDDSVDDAAPAAYSGGAPGNVFEALPPPPNVGRKRQMAALVAAGIAEFTLTGGVLWAPVAAALLAISLTPSKRQLERREAEVTARAEERARQELLRRMPVSPPESAQWLDRMVLAMWRPFVEPLLLKTSLGQWQETVANAAPRGWNLAITDVNLGTDGPTLSDWRAYADPATGQLVAVDCRIALDSDTLKVVVKGSYPLAASLAAFTATVSGIRLAGELRITPVMDQRMLLWGFKGPPSVNVKLAVKSPIGGADLSQFQFIQGIVSSTIQDLLVEPRRGVVPLDYDFRVEEAVATTVNLHVESLTGLPRMLSRTRRAPLQLAVVAVETISRQRGGGTRAVGVAPGGRGVVVRETIKLELPRKEGVVRVEVRDQGAGGRVLGSALLWVSASMDGSTLFWAHGRSGEALARRWGAVDRPWRVTLPLEGDVLGDSAEVRLGVSVEPWVYKQPLVPATYRSSGPHTVVLQIVEARNLGGLQHQQQLARGGGSAANPFVQVQYDQATYATAVAFGTTAPVFLETFAFAENASLLTRRVRLEVWSAPPGSAASAARGGAPGGIPGGGASSASISSLDGGARREYFGGTAVNLDVTTEGAVQDRWYALGGGEGGEVRVRLAVVPGVPEDEGTQEVLDFCCGALGAASRESLLVEVLSARLQLPLSSIDSDDTDAQPLYRITYHGAAYVGEPTPIGRRRRRTTAGRLGLRRRVPVPSGLPPAAATAGAAAAAAAAAGAAAAGTPPQSGAATPGSATPATPTTNGRTSPVLGGPAAAAAAGGTPAAAAGAAAAAARAASPVLGAGGTPIVSSSGVVSAANPSLRGAAGSTDDILARATFAYAPDAFAFDPSVTGSVTGVTQPPLQPPRRPYINYGLLIECCDADVSVGDEVMGSVQVDVQQRLALTDAGCWEGWLKLNKDGGHILVRLTRLPAQEPVDIILPPPRNPPAPPVRVAVPTDPTAAAGAARGGGGGGVTSAGVAVTNAVIGALEVAQRDTAWLGQLVGKVQERQEGLKDQMTEQAQQAATRVNKWMTQAAGWLGPRGGGKKDGKPKELGDGSQQQQQEEKDEKDEKDEKEDKEKGQQQGAAEARGGGAAAAATAGGKSGGSSPNRGAAAASPAC